MRKLSKISLLHFFKFFWRSALFIAATAMYIYHRVHLTPFPFGGWEEKPWFLFFVWCLFGVEMVLRFFPSPWESMGCQKQFARNYRPTGKIRAKNRREAKGVVGVALSFGGLNLVLGLFRLLGWIDNGILWLVSLFFAVADMICILFFCPFQTWFMKNKCCGSCRIYNWDFAMMFTPLLFTGEWYGISLFVMGFLLVLRWEITAHRFPERFSPVCNESLSCANCREKLCAHKKQLRSLAGKWRYTLGTAVEKTRKTVKKVTDRKKNADKETKPSFSPTETRFKGGSCPKVGEESTFDSQEARTDPKET